MKLNIAAFFAAWLFIVPALTMAQNHFVITGRVTDPAGKPLDGATVYLLNGTPDSALVKMELADNNGGFIFAAQKAGSYRLTITMMGYQTYRVGVFTLNGDKPFGDIRLSAAGAQLKEVKISSQRAFVQQKIDRVIINPEALISNAGGTALDVLEKAPGIAFDQNGAINLKGKAVKVFIDDKPTYLSGADLENYLRSLSSASVDQVELMANPPARYDAAGNGGVINIRTKKSKVKGFNGGLNLGYSQGRYARTNNSFNFNYRKNRLNVFGNLSYNNTNAYNDLIINRHFFNNSGALTSNFMQHSYIRNVADNYTAKMGADYYLSDQSTLGVNLTGLYNPRNVTTPVASIFTNPGGKLDSTILAQNHEHDIFRNLGANINYRHQYNKDGRELSADLDYLNYFTNNDQLFDNSSYGAGGALKLNDLLTGSLPAHIDIWSGKVDYEHPLKSGIKLSAGLKSSYTHTNNIADYFYTTAGLTKPDYDKTNHFIYKENINAAYVNASGEYKHFSLQAGLRMENTLSDGHQLGNMQKRDSTFKRSYTSLFPTLYLQYKVDTAGNNQFALNGGRRIDRPYYQDLNPFLSPLDKFTYYTGNPFLRPSFTDNIELSHTYKNRFTTTLSYSRTRDNVDETIEIVNGIYYSKPGNIGRYTVVTLSFDGSIDPAAWFNMQFYGFVSQIHSLSDFYTGTLDTKGTYYFIKPVLSFKPGKDWTLQADGYYQSRITSAQFVLKSRGRVNAAVSKKLSAAMTVKLVMNDIFHTNTNNGIINNLNGATADWTNLSDTRTAVLSLSYRFGKAISGQRKHDVNGAGDEANRVKR